MLATLQLIPESSPVAGACGASPGERDHKSPAGVPPPAVRPSESSTRHGILLHVDLTDSCPQGSTRGLVATDEFYRWLEEQLCQRLRPFDFDLVKGMGDACLFFGEDPENLSPLVRRLFFDDPIPDYLGFRVQLRAVAHAGYFRLRAESNGRYVDTVGMNTNLTFRLDKAGKPGCLLVTTDLRGAICHQFEGQGITESELVVPPPKGFEKFGHLVCYLLHPPQRPLAGAAALPAIYAARRAELWSQVQSIPVFGGLRADLPMEHNFVRPVLEVQAPNAVRPRYNDRLELRDERKSDGHGISVDHLYNEYSHGVIFGLPGAGKTTTLHYLAWRALSAASDTPIIFLNCRDLLPDNFPADFADEADPLRPVLASFLFPRLTHANLAADQQSVLEAALHEFRAAWQKGRVWLLVDALDEAPDPQLKRTLILLARRLLGEVAAQPARPETSGNRFFLTARRAEQAALDLNGVTVFHVKPITLHQFYELAEHLYGGKNELHEKFREAVSRDRAVDKVGGTPLTAMLVILYFEVFECFDLRYATYDLILKFVLHDVWSKVKSGEAQRTWQTLGDFFRTAASEQFLEQNPVVLRRYQALAEVCHAALHRAAAGQAERILPEATLLEHFAASLQSAEGGALPDAAARREAAQWLEAFKAQHLLLRAGPRDYVFLHSSIMEFLAARHLARFLPEPERFAELVAEISADASADMLDTLPILCGQAPETGPRVLAAALGVFEKRDRPSSLLFRCLAECEAAEERLLSVCVTQLCRERIHKRLAPGQTVKRSIYARLRQQVMQPEPEQLEELCLRFGNLMPLRSDEFNEQYLEGWNDAPAELKEARKKFLVCLLGDARVRLLLAAPARPSHPASAPASREPNWLRCDAPGEAEDKNFAYYQRLIGPVLAGFFGSPNLRHGAPVSAAALSPDGRWLAAGDKNGHLMVWEPATGREVRGLSGHHAAVWACAFSPDSQRLVSASEDRTLTLWDWASGRQIQTFTGHKSAVMACAFAPDGRTLVSAARDRTLKLWDALDGRELRTFLGHQADVLACAFSPDGRTVLSASEDRTLKLWETASGRELRTFAGHAAAVLTCAFAADGLMLVSGSEDKTLRTWDAASGRCLKELVGHHAAVWTCALSPDGKKLVSGSDDQTLKLWDVRTGQELRSFAGHVDSVLACAFASDGRTLISGSADKTLKLWDAVNGRELRAVAGHQAAVLSCAFAPDGQTLLSGSWDQTLKLWNTATGRETRPLPGHQQVISSCAFAPDGRTLASASWDQTLKLWDAVRGRELRALAGHQAPVEACDFAPDGRWLVSASEDQTLRIWETASGREVQALIGHQDSVLACAFAPDGQAVVSGSQDRTLKMWEAETGWEMQSFTGHQGPVRACAFSPDGRTLISGSGDRTLISWETASGRRLRAFLGHQDAVVACRFSLDGRLVVSASTDRTVRLWTAATGQLLTAFRLPWVPHSLAFSPVAYHLVTANSNGTLTLFDLSRWLNTPK